MGGGKGNQCYTVGYRYFAGLHLVFCHALDHLKKIIVGDEIAWEGDITASQTIFINQPQLFGGDDKEGGIVGNVDICFGGASQPKNSYLQSILGSSIPAYRGLFGLVINHCQLSALNPYIKEWSILGTRTATGWREDLANITASDGFIDMNPVHIIRETLTNTSWGGLAYPTADLDDDSFADAAYILAQGTDSRQEALGLSLLWSEDSSVEDFIGLVCNHIDGILFFSHVTGLLTLRLIRNDYTLAMLPILNESNVIELVDFITPTCLETINQVTVNWVDRDNNARSTTVQDIAGISRAGRVIPLNMEFVGVAVEDLAQKVASRELQQVCVPISSGKIKINRKNWSLGPGDCFKFTWGPIGISEMVMRVVEIEVGELADNTILVTFARDVYGVGMVSLVQPPENLWTNPLHPPSHALNRKLEEITWWQFVMAFGESEAVLAEIDNNSTLVTCFCNRPSSDALNYQMLDRNVGATDFVIKDVESFPFVATLSLAVSSEVSSILQLQTSYLDTSLVSVGMYAQLGDELVAITAIDTVSKTLTVDRGILDTVPVEHTVGEVLWVHQSMYGLDETERAVTEAVEVKMLPSTSLGRLDISLAPIDTITCVGRMMRPYPPGNLTFCDYRWPTSIQQGRELKINWAHRDRRTQTVTLNRQDEGDIGPEAGVTYNLNIYGDSDVLRKSLTGLTVTNYTYLITDELTDKGSPVGNFSYLKLALSMDGTVGTNSFIDLKNHTVTAYGDVQLSSTETKYGSASAYFDGTDDYLTVDSSDLTFGTADFTIELWVWKPATPTIPGDTLFYQNTTSSGFRLDWDTTDKLSLYLYGDSSTTVGTDTFNLSAWNHVALTREGGVFKLWLNGVLQGSKTLATDCLAGIFYIGRNSADTTMDYIGYMDDFIVRPGIAIYTANFTPPDSIASQLSGLNSSLRIELESVRDTLTSFNEWNISFTRS
jgi:hypothetical protein